MGALLLSGIICTVGVWNLLELDTPAHSHEAYKTSSLHWLASLFNELRLRVLRLRFIRSVQETSQHNYVLDVCNKEMPELLDILSLGLSAGLSFDAALELYCANSKSALAAEMRKTMMLWQMGLYSRREALKKLSERLSISSLQRFCFAVCEALSFGSPLAATLEHQSDAMREEQRALVQERIEEVPVRMLVPLGTLVVPAMLLAILGPLLASAFSG